MSSKQSALSRLIGLNAKGFRLSAGVTLDEFALSARRVGLPWTESRVADFESGRASPSVPTLIAVCLALSEAGCHDVTVAALLSTTESVDINDSLTVSGTELAGWFSGKSIERFPEASLQIRRDLTIPVKKEGTVRAVRVKREATMRELSTAAAILAVSGSAEERVRKRLGLSKRGLAELCAVTWGRSFAAERDARAGEGANAQLRGSIARQLRAELQEAIDRGDCK